MEPWADSIGTEIRVVCKPAVPIRGTVEPHVRNARKHLLDKIISQSGVAGVVVVHMCDCAFDRGSHADDAGRIERAGAHAAFLFPAVHEPSHAQPIALIQHADAFGSVKLVRAHRQHVDPHLLDVDCDAADRLHRVGVEDNAVRAGDRADLADRHQRADFVVGGHDRDQNRPIVDRVFQRARIDRAVAVHAEIRDAETFFFQPSARFEHRGMFDCARNDMVALVPQRLRDALDRPVIALGAARRKINLVGRRVNRAGYLFARKIDRAQRFPSVKMLRRTVAELLRKIRQHLLQYFRIRSRRRRMIQIYFHTPDSSGRLLSVIASKHSLMARYNLFHT